MRKASLISRLIALIIDSVAIWFVGGIIGLVLGEEILGIGVGVLTGLAYNVYFWTQNNGQTPGKKFLSIRVVNSGGGQINVVQAVIRYVGYYISTFIFFLGWLWAIIDGDNQTLHDKLARTYVVPA
ncbi:MAG: RDD family protein [Anaerolineae bacterium]|nr:RDD family protein [Anaerolineae bacterium]